MYIDRRFDLSESEVDTEAELDMDDKDPSRNCWECEHIYASLTSFKSLAGGRRRRWRKERREGG